MIDRYKGTIFKEKIAIPEKKANSSQYFFRFPINDIGYISLSNLLFIIFYYIVVVLFYLSLYDTHFVLASILLWMNVMAGLIAILKQRNTGKNTLNMVSIMYRYLKNKNITIFTGKKKDIFSKNQI